MQPFTRPALAVEAGPYPTSSLLGPAGARDVSFTHGAALRPAPTARLLQVRSQRSRASADRAASRLPIGRRSLHLTPSHRVCLTRGGRLSAVPTVKANVPAGASVGTRCDDWGQQKGVSFCAFHAADFSPCQTGEETGGPMKRSYGGTHLDTAQKQLPLLGRLEGPSIVPSPYIEGVASYRQAVRLCWALRRVHYMTREQAAAEAGLYAKHVSDYLADDDKPGRRSLPGERVSAFEAVCGNSAISQWMAARSNLTVLEQIQADRRAA